MPFGYSIWLWLKANPAAQWALAIGGVWITFRLWLARKISREREDAAEEAVEEVVKQIEEENTRVEEAVDQADRDAVERLNSEQLRKLTERDPLNRGRAPRD
jgi:DNA-binding transcriptional regulator GbsR (MarR family)